MQYFSVIAIEIKYKISNTIEIFKSDSYLFEAEKIAIESRSDKLSLSPEIYWENTKKEKLKYYGITIDIQQENHFNNNLDGEEIKKFIKNMKKKELIDEDNDNSINSNNKNEDSKNNRIDSIKNESKNDNESIKGDKEKLSNSNNNARSNSYTINNEFNKLDNSEKLVLRDKSKKKTQIKQIEHLEDHSNDGVAINKRKSFFDSDGIKKKNSDNSSSHNDKDNDNFELNFKHEESQNLLNNNSNNVINNNYVDIDGVNLKEINDINDDDDEEDLDFDDIKEIEKIKQYLEKKKALLGKFKFLFLINCISYYYQLLYNNQNK